MKYIDAEKLKAEIKRRKFEWEAILTINNIDNLIAKNCCYEDDAILDFIDSLQQEQPEVDLDKEILKYFSEIRVKDDGTPILCDCKFKVTFAIIARHFYELGLNAKKEK